ncbi:hypothetical protein C8R44DRAFT_923043 [Mycena epipterygia]|nr:hypothetical protein C8R44DRAFT_923043 [Mycena epipterygia]
MLAFGLKIYSLVRSKPVTELLASWNRTFEDGSCKILSHPKFKNPNQTRLRNFNALSETFGRARSDVPDHNAKQKPVYINDQNRQNAIEVSTENTTGFDRDESEWNNESDSEMDISRPSTPFKEEQVLSTIQPIFSGQIPDVPPELWAMVAALSKRESVAHLCAVSHAFYALFSPILYNMLIKPPLTSSQSRRLIKMLSEAHTSPFKPHPATLIRSLVGPDSWSYFRPIEPQECHGALMNLYLTPEDGRPMCGSALRTLAWNYLESGTDELATILQKPGCFPNLTEISVRCRGDVSFDFVHILNLEKLEVSWTLGDMKDEDYTTWPTLWGAFSTALKTIPSSPLLRALKLKLYLRDYRHDLSPLCGSTWDAYAKMITAINEMRLPALTALDFAVDVEDFVHHAPVTDFSPFLREHPQLTRITLGVAKMRIPTEMQVAEYMPRLRVFTGSLVHCAAIVARARELEHLFILLSHSNNEHDDVPTLFPPNVGPTVTLLNVSEVDRNGPTEYAFKMSPQLLDRFVSAFPNIAHLDVNLGGYKMRKYCASFAALARLEYLCIRGCKSAHTGSATAVFPPEKYATLIRDALLPSLAQLSCVQFHFRGDREQPNRGCSSCDRDNWSPPDLKVEYRFWVDRAGLADPEVTLVEKVLDTYW